MPAKSALANEKPSMGTSDFALASSCSFISWIGSLFSFCHSLSGIGFRESVGPAEGRVVVGDVVGDIVGLDGGAVEPIAASSFSLMKVSRGMIIWLSPVVSIK